MRTNINRSGCYMETLSYIHYVISLSKYSGTSLYTNERNRLQLNLPMPNPTLVR